MLGMQTIDHWEVLNVVVRLGNYMLKVYGIFCDFLAAPDILNFDFCNCFA